MQVFPALRRQQVGVQLARELGEDVDGGPIDLIRLSQGLKCRYSRHRPWHAGQHSRGLRYCLEGFCSGVAVPRLRWQTDVQAPSRRRAGDRYIPRHLVCLPERRRGAVDPAVDIARLSPLPGNWSLMPSRTDHPTPRFAPKTQRPSDASLKTDARRLWSSRAAPDQSTA